MADTSDDLISEIVETEWKLFQAVPNIGGQAACQQDYQTFEINRRSQAASWSAETLASYLSDLRQAERDGRNLVTEKYARMMKSTSPEEYEGIEHLLPPLEPEVPALIDRITEIVMAWEEELSTNYPRILRRGRPLYSWQDSPFVTSLETYLRGELATYSPRTLELHLENLLKQKSGNVNGSEISLYHVVQRYGFHSLQEANEKL